MPKKRGQTFVTEIERKLKVLVKGLDIKWIKDLRYDWT